MDIFRVISFKINVSADTHTGEITFSGLVRSCLYYLESIDEAAVSRKTQQSA
jgi:hypothetical protein